MRHRHKIKKKAQAAMEFLMTYGWAIMVVLAVVGALTYLVDIKSLVSDRCQLQAPLYCKSYKADSTAGTSGQVTLLIRNGLADGITVTGINLVDKGCDVTGLSVAIASNTDVPVTIDCGVTAGEKVKTDVRITYNEEEGLSGMTNKGNLIVRVAGTPAAGGSTTTNRGICQNAQNGGLCAGLDLVYGEGYQVACCLEYRLCC